MKATVSLVGVHTWTGERKGCYEIGVGCNDQQR